MRPTARRKAMTDLGLPLTPAGFRAAELLGYPVEYLGRTNQEGTTPMNETTENTTSEATVLPLETRSAKRTRKAPAKATTAKKETAAKPAAKKTAAKPAPASKQAAKAPAAPKVKAYTVPKGYEVKWPHGGYDLLRKTNKEADGPNWYVTCNAHGDLREVANAKEGDALGRKAELAKWCKGDHK